MDVHEWYMYMDIRFTCFKVFLFVYMFKQCLMETQCYMRWVSCFEPLVFMVIKSHSSIATFYLHDLLLGDLFLS